MKGEGDGGGGGRVGGGKWGRGGEEGREGEGEGSRRDRLAATNFALTSVYHARQVATA